ncbi:MAG: type II secretion system protein J [Bacteriovoracia bacterium]
MAPRYTEPAQNPPQNSGLSLIEVLLAIGLAGMLSLAVASTVNYLNQGMRGAQFKQDAQATTMLIRQVLGDPGRCALALQRTNSGRTDPGSDSAARLDADAPIGAPQPSSGNLRRVVVDQGPGKEPDEIVRIGKQSGGLLFKDMNFVNLAGKTQVTVDGQTRNRTFAELLVTYEDPQKGTNRQAQGAYQLLHRVGLTILTIPGTGAQPITECYSAGAQAPTVDVRDSCEVLGGTYDGTRNPPCLLLKLPVASNFTARDVLLGETDVGGLVTEGPWRQGLGGPDAGTISLDMQNTVRSDTRAAGSTGNDLDGFRGLSLAWGETLALLGVREYYNSSGNPTTRDAVISWGSEVGKSDLRFTFLGKNKSPIDRMVLDDAGNLDLRQGNMDIRRGDMILHEGELLIGANRVISDSGQKAKIYIGGDTSGDIEFGSTNPAVRTVSLWNRGSASPLDVAAGAGSFSHSLNVGAGATSEFFGAVNFRGNVTVQERLVLKQQLRYETTTDPSSAPTPGSVMVASSSQGDAKWSRPWLWVNAVRFEASLAHCAANQIKLGNTKIEGTFAPAPNCMTPSVPPTNQLGEYTSRDYEVHMIVLDSNTNMILNTPVGTPPPSTFKPAFCAIKYQAQSYFPDSYRVYDNDPGSKWEPLGRSLGRDCSENPYVTVNRCPGAANDSHKGQGAGCHVNYDPVSDRWLVLFFRHEATAIECDVQCLQFAP